MTVKLKEVTRENWRVALTLAVKPEQQAFIADYEPIAAIILSKAYVRPGGLIWVPFAVYADDQMIGLIELAFEPDSADQFWIYHFFIDERYQGRGYGKQALSAIVNMVKNSYCTCQVIQTTVHPENTLAQHLYASAGFIPTGTMANGEPVYQLRVIE